MYEMRIDLSAIIHANIWLVSGITVNSLSVMIEYEMSLTLHICLLFAIFRVLKLAADLNYDDFDFLRLSEAQVQSFSRSHTRSNLRVFKIFTCYSFT